MRDDKPFPMPTSEGPAMWTDKAEGHAKPCSGHNIDNMDTKCGLLMACLTGQFGLPSAPCLLQRLCAEQSKRLWCCHASCRQTDRQTPLVRDRLKARE